MRIGETLGLRREDMHLLSNSASLGCRVAGPHVHVRRRANANGALAKSRFPRSIPVTEELVGLYADYAHERDRVGEAAGCDMVFVNLYRQPLGRPLGYHNAKDMFDRLARRAGFAVRPHVLRHTAATRWVRCGSCGSGYPTGAAASPTTSGLRGWRSLCAAGLFSGFR